MKFGILAASFGTTHPDAQEKTIWAVVEDLSALSGASVPVLKRWRLKIWKKAGVQV